MHIIGCKHQGPSLCRPGQDFGVNEDCGDTPGMPAPDVDGIGAVTKPIENATSGIVFQNTDVTA